MRNEIHRIIARHVLFLQEIGGVAFAFGKDRDKHVRTGHFGATGRLHVNGGALDHALESGRWHGFGSINIGDQIVQVLVDEFNEGFAQFGHVDRTGLHHLNRIGFIDQGQQQMFKRCKLVLARVCERQSRVNGLF